MGVLESLSLAMGAAWTSGINLYATIAALGIAGSAGMIQLPPDLQILTHPLVIGIACVMYAVEFFADKVPLVDSGWDVLHTFIRVPAGAILAARAMGDTSPALELAALLAGGTVALAAHGTKATVRLAINTSPEPFSNWVASVSEDVAALEDSGSFFIIRCLCSDLSLDSRLLAVWLVPRLFRLAKRGFKALRERFRGERPTGAPGAPTMTSSNTSVH